MGKNKQDLSKSFSLLDRPLITKKDVDFEAMERKVQAFCSSIEKRTQREFVIEDRTWFFSYADLATETMRLIRVLNDAGVLVVDDIVKAQSPFSVPSKAEFLKLERRPIPAFCSFNFNPSNDWPRTEGMVGATIIMGDTGSGKTHFIRHHLDSFIIRFGEPFEDVDFQEGVIPSTDLFNALSSAMLMSALGCHVAIDSLRLVIYGLKGNPMEGGVISAVFGFCTELNNLFADLGFSVVVALNPMLSDDSKAHRLAIRLEASCAGIIHLVGREIEYQSYRTVTGRQINNEQKPVDAGSEQSKDPGSKLYSTSKTERNEFDSFSLNMGRITESASEDRVAHNVFGIKGDDSDTEELVRPTAHFNL